MSLKKQKNQTQKKVQKKIRNSEFFQKFYFLIPILSVGSTLWTAILLTCFPDLFIVNDKLTWYSITITIVLIVPNAILTLLKSHYDSILKHDSNIEVYKKSQALYAELIKAFQNIVDNKLRRLRKIISHNDGSLCADPSEQISDIFKELQKALCFLLSNKKRRVDEEDIYINLLFNIDGSDDWIMRELNQEGLSRDALLTDKSFFKYLLNNNSNFLFFNDKQELLDIDHYIQDERDIKEEGRLKGSILGHKFHAINITGHQINGLIFVSTFSTRFVEPNRSDEDISSRCDTVEKNIKNLILPQFVSRIEVELCNEYITTIINTNITSQP